MFRSIHKEKDASEEYEKVVKKLEVLCRAICPSATVGVGFGSPIKEYFQKGTLNEDIFFFFLLDSIDIDSKMTTFVKNHLKEKEKVFSQLYKFDPSQ